MTRSRRSESPIHRRTETSAGRFAFTLIEMLVVVAVIALLVSILLPSLSRARQQAKLVACRANLHDLGSALLQYATVHDPYFPPTPYMGSEVGTSPNGDDNLFVLWYAKYARNPQSFTCPATQWRLRTPERVEKVRTTWGTRYDAYTGGVVCNDFAHLAQRRTYGGYGTSYEYNLWYEYGGRSTQITWFHAAAPFDYGSVMKTLKAMRPAPAYSILMHDGDDGGDIAGSGAAAINNWPERWDNHGAVGMNILFADGHVVFVRRDDVDKAWRQQNVQ